MLHIKLTQFAVRCALPPRRSESPGCATDNKPSCVLHLLGWFIGSRGFSSLERRPKFWVLQSQGLNPHLLHWWVDSLLLSHQGSPLVLLHVIIFVIICLILVFLGDSKDLFKLEPMLSHAVL